MITTQINEKILGSGNIVQFIPKRENHIRVDNILLDVNNYEECVRIHSDIAEKKSALLKLRLDLISYYLSGNTDNFYIKTNALDSKNFVKLEYLKYTSQGLVRFVRAHPVNHNIDLRISELDDVCTQLLRIESSVSYECCKIRLHHHNKKNIKRM